MVRVRTTRYTIKEGNDNTVTADLTNSAVNLLQQALGATVADNSTLVNAIVKRIADGLIFVPQWFKDNNISWYQAGQITATELINAYNDIKQRGLVTEFEGAPEPTKETTQTETTVTTTQQETTPPIIFTGIPKSTTDLPPGVTFAPHTSKNLLTQGIAVLFMLGIASTFMKGVKK